MNDPGLRLDATFVSRILALAKLEDGEERAKLCKLTTKESAEGKVLKYLSESPLWEAFVELAKHPLYSTLVPTNLRDWSSRSIMNDVSLHSQPHWSL